MKDDTKVVAAGRAPHSNHGIVNPPVYHASTVLFPTLAALRAGNGKDPRQVVYGRNGTPTTHALQDAFCALEGGDMAVACASGKAAIVTVLMAYLQAGDHILITDSAYQPTRTFTLGVLERFGVEASFYDPRIGADITELIRPNTRVVFVESPGSITFEMQDIPAIAEAAHDRGAMVVADNTWAGGYFCKPHDLGADVVLQAGTKYVVGHSDAMCGLVSARAPHDEALWKTFVTMGNCIGPDDAYLAQRGIRTIAVRLQRHHETGLQLARWLETRPEVQRVLHPGLESDPGHALWKRDFTGASGLFGVLLHPVSDTQLAAMLDDLELFGMGWSWGGYESLLVPVDPSDVRTATPWQEDGQLLRIHAGLEGPADLIDELDAALARLNAAG
ncbi:MAG: cystathionine beta-lyase [Rhodospirillaceae bacterium]|nr:cystathionine beta-lyase [Rhodospirillaceae bacterium]